MRVLIEDKARTQRIGLKFGRGPTRRLPVAHALHRGACRLIWGLIATNWRKKLYVDKYDGSVVAYAVEVNSKATAESPERFPILPQGIVLPS